MSDLDEILNGEDAEVVEDTETEATAETEASEEVVDNESETTDETKAETTDDKDDQESDESQETDESDASSASQDDKNAEAIAGLTAELGRIRQKNRDLEERMARPQTEDEKPDFFADPDAAMAKLTDSVDARISKARIDMSEQMARSTHDDFDTQIEVFQEMAQENPALWAEMSAQVNPAEWAYKQAERKTELAEIGDLGTFKDRIRAEAKAEALKEFQKDHEEKIEAEIKKRSGLPSSLSDARSISGKDVDTDNDSLDSIMGR